MSALTQISRILAVVFGVLTIYWPVRLLVTELSGALYERGEALLMCAHFGAVTGVVGAALYGSYRYFGETRNPVFRGALWVFVLFAGLGGIALVVRIIWIEISAYNVG